MILVIDNYDSFTYNLVQYLGELGAEVVVKRNDEITMEEIKALKPDGIMLSPGPCTPDQSGVCLRVLEEALSNSELGTRNSELRPEGEGDRVTGDQAPGAEEVLGVRRSALGAEGEAENSGLGDRNWEIAFKSEIRNPKSEIQNPNAFPPVFGVCLGYQAMGQVAGGTVAQAKNIMHGKTSQVRHDGKGLFKDMPNPFRAVRYHSLVVTRDSVPPGFIVTATAEDDGEIMGMRHESLPIAGVQFHPESVLTENGIQIVRNFLESLS